VKTILVTGGAGFIGSNFVHYLYRTYPDYRILVLDALTYAGSVDNLPVDLNSSNDDRINFWYGDVRNTELVNMLVRQSDAVVHFAAETHVTRSIFDNQRFFETDVLGTHTVANAVLGNIDTVDRFIHISSSEVYGTAHYEPMDEEHPLMPMSPYASAKAGADRLVYSYWATYKLPAVIIRPFNNYGPYQHLEKVVPRFITSCLLDEPLTVHGDGSAARDWVYVEDTCKGIDAALHCDVDKVAGEAINFGTGRAISVAQIAEAILEKMGKSSSLVSYITDRPGQVVKHISAKEKAGEILGWSPTVNFEDGLQRTIDWYRANTEWWQKQLWMRKIPIRAADGTIVYH
jgi:dTDP-glucose 4,6-dehydratase